MATIIGNPKENTISRGTRCRQYLFSVSLSPPQGEAVPLSVFQEAIQRIIDLVGRVK